MLKPFVKWPGGKTSELKAIIPRIPSQVTRYFEPFVGGGAVAFALSESRINHFYINDFSTELYLLFSYVKQQDPEFHKHLQHINDNWILLEHVVTRHIAELRQYYENYKQRFGDERHLQNQFESFLYQYADEFGGMLIDDDNPHIENFRNELFKNIRRKFKRMMQLEQENGLFLKDMYEPNIETVFKSAFYMHIRYLYNHHVQFDLTSQRHIAHFYFIREYCYSSMFRFNSSGHFNVPYGGMNYNRKDFTKKLIYLNSEDMVEFMSKVTILNMDFEEFLNGFDLDENDFVFLDPPYDTEFSEYDRNTFSRDDQIRLRDFLLQTKAKFMLVIKQTEFISEIYKDKTFLRYRFDKKYAVSFMNRNNQDVEHLIITNYRL
jgi:DNA adenine methylase